MDGFVWLRKRAGRLAASLNSSLRTHAQHVIATAGVFALAGILAAAISAIETKDRIVAGNTGGSISVLLELEDSRVLIGAGPSRSHAANLVGGITRPWDREIDLLLLPGWDDHHAAGAIGLLERRSVNSIAVVGLPGEEPVWTHLERDAQLSDVSIRYLDRTHRLDLGDNSSLLLSSAVSGSNGSWFQLEHLGIQIDIIDAQDAEPARPDPRAFRNTNDHVVINMREPQTPGNLSPELLVSPSAFWHGDFNELESTYWTGVDRNDHVVLEIAEKQASIPLDSVTEVPD
jgi:hypothetical protein